MSLHSQTPDSSPLLSPKVATLDEHLSALMSYISPLQTKTVRSAELTQASSLTHLAEDITTRIPVPVFSNSGVDGFLVRDADLSGAGPWIFPVAGDIPAGAAPLVVPPGQAIRIMTGAPVGENTSGLRVIPVELTDAADYPTDSILPAQVTVHSFVPARRNIRHRGEHLNIGDIAVSAGTRVDAGTIATLLSVGATLVKIHRVPKVAVVTTGDELSQDAARPWSIPNSNGAMAARLLYELGITKVIHRHLPDQIADFSTEMTQLAAKVDLIITMGGISAGAYDVVRMAGQTQGTVYFGHVNMSPGKPQGYGKWDETPVICLPGNPVASWVSIALFVAPALRHLAGAKAAKSLSELPIIQLEAPTSWQPRARRWQAIPVKIDWQNNKCLAPQQRRSHMIASTINCDGLALIPPAEAANTTPPLDNTGNSWQVAVIPLHKF
ncbi:molybdopterin molybdotransferase MoeA [Corynebacterium caspium]|uniref:molybdopterin molybdotransferase MoeA n=1 Tax=Corynebacterium caspium TaxID=234828 RepID=UPI0003720F41|nr:molybdopterin molybdotransferase MoeA [Corynebacterium caspium]WKD59467.1 Molybdopterin molybdenumtransferase [Corynebacterium caspium DSM 44850]